MNKISFSPPNITQLEIDAVVDTLRSGWITTGPKTKQFELALAAYCGTERAVCLNSATAALELTLRLLGIGPGDEVITTAYTYSASAAVINHVGAIIRLVDVKKDSFFMDEDALNAVITPRTKAIIPVDIAGIMCDYEQIFQLVHAKKNLFQPKNPIQESLGRIAIISDAAHSLGATRNGQQAGQAADFTCFSFHAVKNLTTAEGGAITWNCPKELDDSQIYRNLMLLSLHGQSKDALAKSKSGDWEYDILLPGYKCNMTDIQAALGLAQLQRYADLLARRKQLIELYNAGLKGYPIEVLEHYSPNSSSSGHLYLTRIIGANETKRNSIIQQLAAQGIGTNVHYKPLPMFTAYKKLGFDISNYPNAYAQYANEITLPLHTQLTEAQVEYVLNQLKSLLDK